MFRLHVPSAPPGLELITCMHCAEEHAPPALKSIWLAIFLMAIPVGYALGYIYGAIIGTMFGWRVAFMSEATIMLPFVIFAFRTRPVPLGKGVSSSWVDIASSPRRTGSPPPGDALQNMHGCDGVVPDGDDAIRGNGSMRSAEHGSQRSASTRGYGKGAAGGSPERRSPVLPHADAGGALEAPTERVRRGGDEGSPRCATGAGWGADDVTRGSGSLERERTGGHVALSHRGAPVLHAPLKRQVRWMLSCAATSSIETCVCGPSRLFHDVHMGSEHALCFEPPLITHRNACMHLPIFVYK